MSRHKICNEDGKERITKRVKMDPAGCPEAACFSALFRVGHGNSCSLHSSVVVAKQEKT